jgi:hypothetical protein
MASAIARHTREPIDRPLRKPTVVSSARLCKALLDRVTDRAHIIERGTESHRFRCTMEKTKNKQHS